MGIFEKDRMGLEQQACVHKRPIEKPSSKLVKKHFEVKSKCVHGLNKKSFTPSRK
jgi:hypothetical protein